MDEPKLETEIKNSFHDWAVKEMNTIKINDVIDPNVEEFVLNLAESLGNGLNPNTYSSISAGIDGGVDICWDNKIYLVVDSDGTICFRSYLSDKNKSVSFSKFDKNVFNFVNTAVVSLLNSTN